MAQTEGTEMAVELDERTITEIIIGCAIEVHRAYGPGLLESAYKECLSFDLLREGLIVEKE